MVLHKSDHLANSVTFHQSRTGKKGDNVQDSDPKWINILLLLTLKMSGLEWIRDIIFQNPWVRKAGPLSILFSAVGFVGPLTVCEGLPLCVSHHCCPRTGWGGLVENNPKKKYRGYEWGGFECQPKGGHKFHDEGFEQIKYIVGYMVGIRDTIRNILRNPLW